MHDSQYLIRSYAYVCLKNYPIWMNRLSVIMGIWVTYYWNMKECSDMAGRTSRGDDIQLAIKEKVGISSWSMISVVDNTKDTKKIPQNKIYYLQIQNRYRVMTRRRLWLRWSSRHLENKDEGDIKNFIKEKDKIWVKMTRIFQNEEKCKSLPYINIQKLN